MGNIFNRQDFFHTCAIYEKDTFNVYYNKKKVEQATAKTFEDLGHCYGKDVFDVFYKGELIPNADATTFSVDVNGKYAYDSSNTYYMGKKV
jgi:hypothetical protein